MRSPSFALSSALLLTLALVRPVAAGDPADIGEAVKTSKKAVADSLIAAKAAGQDEDGRRLTRILDVLARTPVGKIVVDKISKIPVRDDPDMTRNYAARYTHDAQGEPYIGLGPGWRNRDDEALEFTLLHEGAHACAGLPGELCDDEQQAYQRELEYALQKARLDKGFASRLKERYGRFRELEARRAKLNADQLSEDEKQQYRNDFDREHHINGEDYLGVIALRLSQFRDKPGLFYWMVQTLYAGSPHHATLQEVDDFLRLHGDKLDSIAAPSDGFYHQIEGRRYRWAVIERAREVKAAGGVEAIKKKLGNFDTDGARNLQADIKEWETEIDQP